MCFLLGMREAKQVLPFSPENSSRPFISGGGHTGEMGCRDRQTDKKDNTKKSTS